MRIIAASVLVEVVIATFFPDSITVLFVGLAIAVLALVILKQESLVLLPLLIAMPIAAQIMPSFSIRFGILLMLAAFVLLALSDLAARQHGAPIRFTRLLFWYLSGAYVLLVAFFTAEGEGVFYPLALLVILVIIGAVGAYTARLMARRQRGAEQHPIPPVIDALAVGFLLLEIVIALTFLPLNAMILGALSTITLWLLIRLLVAARAGKLVFDMVFRLTGIAGIVAMAVIAPSIFL